MDCNGTAEKLHEPDNAFVWQDYLDATESVEVPQIMFPHVEQTLQSGIEIGMSLEVPTSKKNDKETSYWIASITMACGPLLRLRYFGGDDRSLEFWFNLTKEAAHELGWSVRNNKKVEPPANVLERSPDCTDKLSEFLITAKSVPSEMISGDELSIVDRIKQGMKVEVNHPLHPYKLWIATIIENVGGRLLLRYDTPGCSVKDFWMFCTSEYIHPYDFSSKSDPNWFLEPPHFIIESHKYEEWQRLTESKRSDFKIPKNLFNNRIKHSKHRFELGMKVEALNPSDRTKICPATVRKIFDDVYFLVQIDIYKDNESVYYPPTEKNTWLCTVTHPYIFPVGWAKKRKIRISHPQGWMSKSMDFNWEEYLYKTKSRAASSELFYKRENASEAGFECGMRLEAVDPENENIICAAHISQIIEDLLWLKLDNSEDCRQPHVVHMHSQDIFPVGWCESNHYPLKPPKDYIEECKKLQTPVEETKKRALLNIPISEPRSSLWCPKIYFNYRCCTGPMISKGKLATLPKAVGPGPVILVMREVLSMIVSVGYRSARILKVLQCDSKPDPGYHLEVLKAKHKNNVYRASVPIVTSGDMVAEFCKSICRKLMVCPNLFGPLHIRENECPDECYKANKSKFSTTTTTATASTGKRGKPKGYTSILVQKNKPWGNKRKRRRGRHANKEKLKEQEDQEEDENQFLSMDLIKPQSPEEPITNVEEAPEGVQPLSEIDIMIQKGEIPSSNVSEDSRSSFNDRKTKDSKESNGSPSPSSSSSKKETRSQNGISTRGTKRDREWDTSVDSDCSEPETVEPVAKKQRRPKTRKLESNPLFWSVDDVFKYLRKTNDCKDIAYRVKQEEIDGLAFLLLNLPSLTQHMKLRTNIAMKLCRHVEQVKVTFFLRHINEVEPEQYQIV